MHLRLWRVHHLPAGGRKSRERDSRLRLGGDLGRLWMNHRMLESEIELMAAAVARRRLRLRLAIGTVGRAEQADMEMIIVPPPRP